MTLFLEIGQYFGTSKNGIEDKQSGTEGVIIIKKTNQTKTGESKQVIFPDW